jgi:3-methyladenine DNA glycosylase AlkD
MLDNLIKELEENSSPQRAESTKRFFKTGKGEYSHGDIFIGLTMGKLREIAKKYQNISFSNVRKLLDSEIHEHRMVAGIILVNKFRLADPNLREEIFNLYIKNAKKFNNWDLVDVTCSNIVGEFLIDKNKKILYDLAKSKNLWEQRISVVSTYNFIKKDQFGDALKIFESLLSHKHDLIHKAIGWMLREVGKRNHEVLLDFLSQNYEKLPRTTLRYAIEKFPQEKRKEFLKGKF